MGKVMAVGGYMEGRETKERKRLKEWEKNYDLDRELSIGDALWVISKIKQKVK